MNPLQKRIAEHLESSTVNNLCDIAGISRDVLYRIMRVTPESEEIFDIKTLSRLYRFFKLEYDDRYKMNLRSHYPATPGILGSVLREKRIEKWYSQEYIADRAKLDKRVIVRLEMWYTLPSLKTYTLSTILSILEVPTEEQKIIHKRVEATRNLNKISQKGIDKIQNEYIYDDNSLFTPY